MPNLKSNKRNIYCITIIRFTKTKQLLTILIYNTIEKKNNLIYIKNIVKNELMIESMRFVLEIWLILFVISLIINSSAFTKNVLISIVPSFLEMLNL